MEHQKMGIYYNGKSWAHNIKLLSDDGKTKYSKRAGFQTFEEALHSATSYEKEFKEALRRFHLKNKINFDISLKDYLIYWYNEIYSSRVEATARMLGQYTLYYLIFPQLEKKIKLRYANTEYFNALLKRVAGICPSAGNKGREVLNIAMRDAFVAGHISSNPILETEHYPRRKPEIKILSKQQIKILLQAAEKGRWYLEILLGMFCGLRKGDDDDKIRLNQRKPSKYKGLRRFGPEKNLQRINKFMKERPIFYKNLIQMKENIRFYLRCFYCITKVMILQFNSENRTELARNG